MNAAFMHALELVSTYGYWIILPIAILEGPIISIVSGFLVSLGFFSAQAVFAVLLAGDLFGDALYYSLGRWGGPDFIRRWGKFVGVKEEDVQRLEENFVAHDWKLIFFSKTQAFGSAILFYAGVARMPYQRYALYNLLASIPKVLLFEFIGIHFGNAYAQVSRYVTYATLVSLAIAVALIIVFFVSKRVVTKRLKPPAL